jgi:hypothetical protein
MEDYKEEVYMAGAGNIDEESDRLYRESHKYDPDKRIPHKWTLEELAGRVMVRCEVSMTGLKPFIQQEGAFDSASEGVGFFFEMVKRSSVVANGKIECVGSGINGSCICFDLYYQPTKKICGSGKIELVDVAE